MSLPPSLLLPIHLYGFTAVGLEGGHKWVILLALDAFSWDAQPKNRLYISSIRSLHPAFPSSRPPVNQDFLLLLVGWGKCTRKAWGGRTEKVNPR